MATKKKVSVSLTDELLQAIKDKQAVQSRSAFIERGMRDYLLDRHGVMVPIPRGK